MTFNNVVVPKSGLYTIDWRYAFGSGLFPLVKNRQMGLMVNGKIITTTERFPITGSFDVYQHSSLQVQLNASVNKITLFAVSNHGVARIDQMTVTEATASVASGPTNLVATAGNATVKLTWTGAQDPSCVLPGMVLSGGPSSQPPPQCPDGIVLAAMGSGQSWSGDTDLSHSPELKAVYGEIAAKATGKTLGLHVINYPAQDVTKLYAGLDTIHAKNAVDYGKQVRRVALKNLNGYLAGKQQGVTELLNVFARQHKACPNSRLLLAGYSQGAMVVHEFLNLQAGKKDRSADRAVLGAVLVADPERVAHSKVTEVADADDAGKGICVVANAAGVRCLPQGQVDDVRKPFATSTLSVCSSLDPVCDTSSLLSAVVQAYAVGEQKSADQIVKNVVDFHGTGYGTYQPTKIAAGVLGTRLKNS